MHHEADVVLPALLAALGIERPVLVGHSDGASIALLAAGAGLPVDRARAAGAARDRRGRQRRVDRRGPRRLRRRPTCATASAATTTTSTSTFRGWNDVWLDRRRSATWDITDRLAGDHRAGAA